MSKQIREPKQERSIEKKNKIVKAGFELFSSVGYYNTNTAEIAKYAGVSTGIVYGYFKDKRDILIEVLSIYIESVFNPILSIMDTLTPPINFGKLIKDIIDKAIDVHRQYANIHEALHSMTHSDDIVSNRFMTLEDDITIRIATKLQSLGLSTPNLLEKVHFAMNIVQSYSHEFVFDHHTYINYDEMRTLVEGGIARLFEI